MSAPQKQIVAPLAAIDLRAAQRRLETGNGGYEVVHESPGLEVGVYVLVAPEPDRQQPHDDDELYVVLDGRGELTVEGQRLPLRTGDAVFVPAGALHQFTGYEDLSVLVVLARRGPTATHERVAEAPS